MTPNDVLQTCGVRGVDVLEAQAHLTATGPGYDSGVHDHGLLVVWKPEDEREHGAAFQVPAAVDSTATDRHIPDPAGSMQRVIEKLYLALHRYAAKSPKVKALAGQRRHTMTIRPARIWGTVRKGRGQGWSSCAVVRRRRSTDATWLSYGPVLSWVLVSPAQHQIHHSRDPKHLDKNFGLVFSFWDAALGSLYIPPSRENLTYGLAGVPPGKFATVRQLYVTPFVEASRMLLRSPYRYLVKAQDQIKTSRILHLR